MKVVSLTRTTIGIMIIAGLLWCKPLIWLCGIMMLFAGLTGVCFLDLFYRILLGRNTAATGNDGKAGDLGGGCA